MKILNKLELMSPSIKVGGSNGYSVELPKNAGALLTEESTNDLISTAKTEAINESKNYTDQKVSSVYRVKGTVPSVEDLPEDAEIGDVYNISDDLGGHNYVKTESGWDKLGGTVDLSPYALKTDVSGCVSDLEDKITEAQNSAVSTSNAYTDACIVAANLSQYAKAEDVYTKTAADSTFVKIGDDTTGDVDAETVEAENVEVSGCLVVSGNSTFSGCTTFCQVPNINGDYVATVCSTEGYINERLCSLPCHYLPATSAGSGDNGLIAYCVTNKVDFVGGTFINGLVVATQDYVDNCFCSTKDYINECLCNYLPVISFESQEGFAYCVENNVDFLRGLYICSQSVATQDYVNSSICSLEYLPASSSCSSSGCIEYNISDAVKFTKTLTYGESEVATVADIPTDYLKVTSDGVCGHHVDYFVNSSVKFKNTLKAGNFEANSGSFSDALTFNNKNVATVDQIPTDFYTTSQADAAFEKSGCAALALEEAKTFASVCAKAVEDKIPTDYLPTSSCACEMTGRVTYCVEDKVDFVGGASIDGLEVATQNYVDTRVGGAISNLQYLPAAQCGNIDPYIVCSAVKFTKTLTYGESEVATVADIPTDYLPATKIADGRYDASSVILDLFYLNVNSGATLPESTTINNENVATIPYVNTIRSCTLVSAQAYTDERIASLGSVLEYKGNKTYAELPTEGNEVGDVYNITADYAEKGIKAGDNVVWNGSDWDVLSGPIDLSGYYDKSEVDEKLEGYLPADNSDGVFKVNEDVVFTACGVRFSSGVYFDDHHVYLNVPEINSLSPAATEYSVSKALEGYLPATATAEVDCTTKYTVDGRLFIGKEGESKVTSISYQHFCTYDIQACIVHLVSDPTDENHATPKSYVDARVKCVSDSVYTKTEVDKALEGYYEVVEGVQFYSSNIVLYKNGGTLVDIGSEGNEFWKPVSYKGSSEISDDTHLTPKSYVDAQVKTATDAITTLSGCVYTKSEVDNALEGYLPVDGTCGMLDEVGYMIHCAISFAGSIPVTYGDPLNKDDLLTPTDDGHLTNKKYVDDLVSTSISTANANIVYDQDFVLGDGTFDASTSQMKWTISPEGATKILSVIALDGEGNLVHPSYKWANNTLTVSIFAEAEQDNPGYTVTVSYKK